MSGLRANEGEAGRTQSALMRKLAAPGQIHVTIDGPDGHVYHGLQGAAVLAIAVPHT